MESFSFGSYYPGDSPIHRLDPRTKLVAGLVFLLAALMANTFAALVPVAVFVVVATAFARIPAKRLAQSATPLMAIVVVVALLSLFTEQSGCVLFELGIIQISEGSLHTALFMGIRLTLMMLGMSLVTLTTTTLDLTAGFERLLAPLARIGLPAHELGMILGIALRFMPQFANEMRITRDAQVSRGARVAAGPLGGVRMLASMAIPLFVSVFRRAETLSAARGERVCIRCILPCATWSLRRCSSCSSLPWCSCACLPFRAWHAHLVVDLVRRVRPPSPPFP